MNKAASRVLSLLSALLLPALASALPKVAVLDLSVQKGIDASVVAPVTESLMEEVVGSRAYVVLDRAYIEQVLKEKEFQRSGLVSDTQVAQAGQYLGADYVVAGKIQLVGDTYLVVAKMIEVKTGVIVAQSSEQGEGKLAVLLGLAHAVGKKLVVGSPISPLSPSLGSAATSAPAAASAPGAAAAQPAQPATGPGRPSPEGPAGRIPGDRPPQGPSDEEFARLADLQDPVPRSKVKLSIYALRDPASVGDEAWKAVLDAFRERYPSISLSVEETRDSGAYYQRLSEGARTGKLPDLFLLGADRRLGAALPAKDLRPLLRGREALFLRPAIERIAAEGGLSYLPETVVASHALFADGELLSRLGLAMPGSLEELLSQAPRIRAAGLTPIAMADKDGWEMQSCLLSVLAARTGGPGWLPRTLGGKGASFRDPPFVAALDIIRRLAEARMFPDDILELEYAAALEAFKRGEAVYHVNGLWCAGELAASLSPERKERMVVAAFPELGRQAGPPGSTSAIVRGFAMNRSLSGDKEAAAWLWLWFYSGPEGQRLRFERGGGQGAAIDPRRLGLYVDPLWAKAYELLSAAPLVDIIDFRMETPFVNAGLKELLAGRKRPEALAQEIEAWVARNDPNRRR